MRRAEPPSDRRGSFDDLLGIVKVGPCPAAPDPGRLRDILDLAYEHRVAGLVATRLLERPETLTTAARADLREVALAHRGRAVLALLVADEVGRGLAAAAIPGLVIKGAGLVGPVYRSLAERTLGDLDVLVPAARFAEAEDLLRSLGFDEAVAPRSRRYFEHHHFHVPWKSPRGIGLDLHWDLSRGSDGFRLDILALLERSVSPPIAAGAFLTPRLSDALLLQCLQHHQEGFSCLARAVDVDRIGRALGPEQWEEMVAAASASGLKALAWAALETSRVLLGTPVENGVLQRLSGRGPVRAALASIRPDLLVREASAMRDPALRWLVRLWTAPDRRTRFRILRDLLAVEPGYWEDRYFVPRESIPVSKRLRVRLGRAHTAIRLAAWQARRLLVHRRAIPP